MANHFSFSGGKVILTLALASLTFFSLQAQDTEIAEPVSTVKASLLSEERLEDSHGTDWTTLLQQEVPGMTPDLLFRRQNRPLVFIDGLMISQEADLQQILPSATEISSIQFVKGPEALAKYGVRGVLGVLIIETKNGGFGQGLKWGVYNGYRLSVYNTEEINNLSKYNFPATSSFYESAYLDWSNHKHSIHANYTNQYTYRPSFEGLNGTTFYAYYGMSHAANARYQGNVNEKLKVKGGGMFQTADNGDRFYNLNTGIHYTPSDRVQAQFNIGLTNDQNRITSYDSFEDVYKGEQFFVLETRVERLAISNKEMNLKINAIHPINSKITLTTETGLLYFNSSQISKIKATAELQSIEGIQFDRYTFSEESRNQLMHFVNGFAIGGLEYNEWLKFKLGTHYAISIDEAEFDPISTPFIAVEMDYMKTGNESNVLSRFDFQTSYGQLSTQPILYFNEDILLYRFQSNLNLGILDNKFTLSSTYFTDKSLGGYTEYTVRGWETIIRAKVADNDKMQWTTGLNSLIIREESFTSSSYYFSSQSLRYPFDWQTGWLNQLHWDGFSLNTQVNLQNTKNITAPWEYADFNALSYNYYLNIQEVTLAYRLPASLAEKSVFRRINMGFSARNLLQSTNMDLRSTYYGYNPFVRPALSKNYSINLGLHF